MVDALFTRFAACSAGQVCLDSLPQLTDPGGSWVQTALNIIIAITAALSLLFIVIGGFRYIVSQGDPNGVSKAKSTIVFALIGLAVAVLAQAIVTFVIKGISS